VILLNLLLIAQVHGPGADIDTLCVGPRHATRNVRGSVTEIPKVLQSYCVKCAFHFMQDYFFRCLHDMLAEMPEVSELHPVPDAHVPVLGFKLCGVSIDLLYANLAHVVIPDVSSFTALLLKQYFSIACYMYLVLIVINE
jgi:poly(A) polymerase